MRDVTLKLKQASAVLGVTAKDLQNLVQLGIIRPPRRGNVYWFDTNLLLKAKVAFYLRQSLGSSSDLLAKFTETLSRSLGRTDICLLSRPMNGANAVEIKIPVRALAKELESRLPLAVAYKDLPRGRKRAGWKRELMLNMQKAAADLGDVSEQQILRTIREYRSARKKKLPEITILARTKKKTA